MAERVTVQSLVDAANREGAFARRLIAFVTVDRDVERRVVRPRLEHAVIEIEAVHLGTDDGGIDLLVDRPCVGRNRIQPCLPTWKFRSLTLHRCGAVVGDSVLHGGCLKGTPFLEEAHQAGVSGGVALRLSRHFS